MKKNNQFILLLFCILSITFSEKIEAQKEYAPYSAPQEERESWNKHGIVVHKNIRYGDIPTIVPDSTSDRILNVHLPAEANAPLPVFFFVHGGGFRNGSKDSNKEVFIPLVKAGYAVVSINYRLTLKYHNPEKASCSAYMKEGPGKRIYADGLNLAINNAVEDATQALQWIKDNASEYNLDTSRIAVSGGSAGAITVLYLTFSSQQNVLPIKAVVNCWGAIEDTRVIENGKTYPPVLTYHGDKDKLIHIDYGRALHARLEEVGNTQSILHVLEGKGHALYKYIAAEKMDEIIAFLDKSLHTSVLKK